MAQRYIRTVMEIIAPRVPLRITDGEVIDLWLSRQRSQATRSVYRRDITRLLAANDRKLAQTSALDLERFAEALAGTGLAPISQGRTLAAVRSFFRFAEKIGYCGNPASGLDLPRTEPALSERIIPQEDVRRMIAQEPYYSNRQKDFLRDRRDEYIALGQWDVALAAARIAGEERRTIEDDADARAFAATLRRGLHLRDHVEQEEQRPIIKGSGDAMNKLAVPKEARTLAPGPEGNGVSNPSIKQPRCIADTVRLVGDRTRSRCEPRRMRCSGPKYCARPRGSAGAARDFIDTSSLTRLRDSGAHRHHD